MASLEDIGALFLVDSGPIVFDVKSIVESSNRDRYVVSTVFYGITDQISEQLTKAIPVSVDCPITLDLKSGVFCFGCDPTLFHTIGERDGLYLFDLLSLLR